MSCNKLSLVGITVYPDGLFFCTLRLVATVGTKPRTKL
jgi:hypothetical protein